MALPNPTPPENPVVSGIGTSVVRTLVPLILAPLLAWATKAGFNLDSIALAETLGAILTVLYYALVRTLETKVNPAYGWLLGVAKVPAYPTISNTTTMDAAQDSVNVNVETQPEGAGDNLPPTS